MVFKRHEFNGTERLLSRDQFYYYCNSSDRYKEAIQTAKQGYKVIVWTDSARLIVQKET